MGIEILKFHTIYWPAFLLALGVPEENLPKTMLVTGFFMSGGRKMSKSLGNVIVPKDIIEEFNQITNNLGDDILRYGILREMRIGNDGDITKEKIISIYESELVNKFGNTFSRVIGMAKKYDVQVQRESSAVSQDYHNAFQKYDIYGAIHSIFEQINIIGQEIESHKPWELYKEGKIEELYTLMQNWLKSLHQITEIIEPIMPSTADLMKKLLAGESIHIFPRIER